MKTVIIGGVAGGASAAARLRRLDEKGEIIILERGQYVSFANCGLPYYIGGTIKEQSKLTLQTPASFKSRFNIDVRILNEAVKINPGTKTVTIRKVDTGEIYEENYDNLILSPGAEPSKPAIEGINNKNVFTLRNIPDTLKIKAYMEENNPKTAVIVGGGYIGIEMAENLYDAGIQVSIVERSDHIINALDFDMASEVQKYLRDKGVKLYLNSSAKAIRENAVEIEGGEIPADMVIMATGVTPETNLAKECGIATNEKGSIIVNDKMQTNIEGIYAVGDAIEIVNFITKEKGYIPLAGPANKMGRIAADNIAGFESTYEGTMGASVIKVFDMTVAMTGLTEEAAKAAGYDYDKTYTYTASNASYYPGGVNMSVKCIWDKKTLAILGAQIVGYNGVDKRMDVISTVIRLGGKVTDLAKLELCYAPPFSSAKDPVNMLGFVAENVVSGKLRQFFWHDVADLPRDGSVVLLDTRTPAEVSRGKIDGFMNIPVDNLRERLDEIPTGKPVYVHCHSGLRSYIACMILAGYGFECYNLAGGWRFYESVINEKTVQDHPCYF